MFNLKEGPPLLMMKVFSVCSLDLSRFPQFAYGVQVGQVLCSAVCHAGDMKGMFVTYPGSNIEALVYHKSTVLLGFAKMQ